MAKRRKAGNRHPGGKLVQRPRTVREEDARSVVLAYRKKAMKEQGIPVSDKSQPADAEMESAVGRAFKKGLLAPNDSAQNSAMAAAAIRYEGIQRAYAQAIASRNGVGSSSDYDRVRGYDGDEGDDPDYIERCNSARRKMAESRRALLDADPFAQLAVDAWVMENKAAWGLLPELRVGLNALVRLYRVEER